MRTIFLQASLGSPILYQPVSTTEHIDAPPHTGGEGMALAIKKQLEKPSPNIKEENTPEINEEPNVIKGKKSAVGRPSTKLSIEQILQHQREGMTQKEIGGIYKVTDRTIRNILKGKRKNVWVP